MSVSLCCLLICELLVDSQAFSVSRPTTQSARQQWQRKAVLDPSEMTNAVSQLHHHLQHPQAAEALLNTMFSTANLAPAQGHSNPLFGPPDPYLQAGKSIAPSAKALLDMGISKASTLAQDLPAGIQTALKGYNVLDARSIQPESVMPGFLPTRGILSEHNPMVPAQDSPEAFAVMVEWSVNFLRTVDKLPYLALGYGMIDFFILRPNLDWYKEEVEDEPAQVVAEVMGSTAVRMSIFCVLATLTMTFFG